MTTLLRKFDSLKGLLKQALQQVVSLTAAGQCRDADATLHCEVLCHAHSYPCPNAGGDKVTYGEGVTFLPGVSITLGGHSTAIDPATQLPVPHPEILVSVVEWVDFNFELQHPVINCSARQLLQGMMDTVGALVPAVYNALP